jgi:hypothetical protein
MAAIYPSRGRIKTLNEAENERDEDRAEELLAAIADEVDEGFCPASKLASRFPKLSDRDLLRLQGRAVRAELILER